VFRNEKPGPGRFRQFMQFDADTVGASSPAADAEICMMAADTMEALGIPRGQYVIKVNSRKVLDGVMEAIGVTDERRKLAVLRAIDKLDRLGIEGVRQLLGPGRKDESGDFTKGAGLDPHQIATTLKTLEAEEAGREFSGETALGREGRRELEEIATLAEAAGYGRERIRIDASVVRGLEYYTGPVFEAELLFEIPNEKGQPVVFGSVGGGGRYDGLIGRFRGEDVPATGFSIGVSRLQAALTALGKIDGSDEAGPVVVTVMEPERIADYQRMVASLRNAGIAAELYLGSGRFGAQMKYADRRKAPLAVIQGSDEKAKGVIQIKDLALGKRLSESLADNTAWREERPGQFSVPEAELVAAVLKMVEARR
jgi:histidyl-tRNA synthetase